ncbi:MAG: hypothetical protein K0U68_05455 [Gammaproteobacteria bacterium]|nr:hypothetical protein [Gammaproteobacteria bacterium]
MSDLTIMDKPALETPEWTQQMSSFGKQLKANQVGMIYLVHGTFAGNDALGIFDLIRPFSQSLSDALKKKKKQLVNTLSDDAGNFTPEYAKLLSTSTGIPCRLFTWSSGNFHLARLSGLLDLVNDLAEQVKLQYINSGQNVLLLGHSHAGQLFALLSSFLALDERALRLHEYMAEFKLLPDQVRLFKSNIALLSEIKFDCVTFGTPIRYSWSYHEQMRLLAIVNHRSNVSLSGVLNTRDGDYLQHWGIEGTDMIPPLNLLKANDALDTILDKGRDVPKVIASLEHEQRRQSRYIDDQLVSDTLLIDYKDNAPFSIYFLNPFSVPHCMKTIFGHAVYTRKATMLFNTDVIVEHLYS